MPMRIVWEERVAAGNDASRGADACGRRLGSDARTNNQRHFRQWRRVWLEWDDDVAC